MYRKTSLLLPSFLLRQIEILLRKLDECSESNDIACIKEIIDLLYLLDRNLIPPETYQVLKEHIRLRNTNHVVKILRRVLDGLKANT